MKIENVSIELSGVDEVTKAAGKVLDSMEVLHQSMNDLSSALWRMGVKISQPADGAAD